ncbi:hypothetical protein ACQ7B2_32000, partial [Escherichia coli]
AEPPVGVTMGGRYFLDLELGDTAGHTGTVSFSGDFFATWTDGRGLVTATAPPAGSVRLGDVWYDVFLRYTHSITYY